MDVFEEGLSQLYIRRGFTGRGFGKELLDLAKALSPGRLFLYTFQVNEGARGFYGRECFLEVVLSNGSSKEEGVLDVRMEWRWAKA